MPAPTLNTIQTQMNFYGYPIVMVLGIIGNIFLVIFFNRQKHNAGPIYLMHSAIINLLYLAIAGSFRIFSVAYYDQTLGALILCKFTTYIPNFLGQVARTILILACIDRYLITNDRATFRAFSTPKRAKYLIFFSYIFWLVATSHVLIWTTISNRQCAKVGIYSTIFTFYTILVVGLIPFVTLYVFGYLTYRNMRQLRNRIQPAAINMNNSLQRRDRDLIMLVIAEGSVYIITTTLFAVTLLETTISSYVVPNKSLQYSLAEIFALNVALLLLFTYSAAPFYTFIISSKSFRRDFKQLIMNIYRKMTGQEFDPTAPRAGQTLAQHDTRV